MSRRINVKQLRERLGISQQDLAKELGVHFRSIPRWENGYNDPSPLARKQLEGLMAKADEQAMEQERTSGVRRRNLEEDSETSPPRRQVGVPSQS